MTSPPLVAGPHAPAVATPPRPPGSVRRTTSIDTVRPDGPDGQLVVDARGRDLLTAAELAMACCTRYRIPEPTRQADIEVAKLKRTREGA